MGKIDLTDFIKSYKDYVEEVMLWYMIIINAFLSLDYFYKNCHREYPTYSYLTFLKYTFSLYKSINIRYIMLATLLLPFRLACCILAPLLPILGLAIETIVVPLTVYILFTIAYLPEKYLDKEVKNISE